MQRRADSLRAALSLASLPGGRGGLCGARSSSRKAGLAWGAICVRALDTRGIKAEANWRGLALRCRKGRGLGLHEHCIKGAVARTRGTPVTLALQGAGEMFKLGP